VQFLSLLKTSLKQTQKETTKNESVAKTQVKTMEGMGVEKRLHYDLEDSRSGYEDSGLVGCGAVSQCVVVPSNLKALQFFEISGTTFSMTS